MARIIDTVVHFQVSAVASRYASTPRRQVYVRVYAELRARSVRPRTFCTASSNVLTGTGLPSYISWVSADSAVAV